MGTQYAIGSIGGLMEKPRLAKANSSQIAELYVQTGWTVVREFRTNEKEEPYEYLLEWRHEGDPIRPVLRSN
jgi:hypothetical protein